MPPHPGADALNHEPILYSGDPIESGGHDGGKHPPGTAPRLRGLPLVFLSQGAQVYVGGAPFTDQTAIDDLVNREEVRAAERRAVQRQEPLPDAFVFFNPGKTQVKLLLWTDRGFSVVHQRLDEGAFAFSRNVTAGERVTVAELAELLGGPRTLGAAVSAHAESAPSYH